MTGVTLIIIIIGLNVCSLNIATATVQDTINDTTFNVTEGHNVTITCNVTLMHDSNVFWIKNETNSTFVQYGIVLSIFHVNKSAGGEYLCYSNGTGSEVLEQAVDLNVQYPARITHVNVEPYVVMENSTVNFSCGIEGNPGPDWYIGNRDTGQKVLTANASVVDVTLFIKMECDSSGFWECRGHNSLNNGHDVFVGHNITVHCSPRPQSGMSYDIYSALNATTALMMRFLGNPIPQFTWTGPGYRNITPDSWNTTGSTNTLYIPRLQISDYGNYTVTMNNSFGDYTASFCLRPWGVPVAPTNLHFTHVTAERVTLHWTAGYCMGTWQVFYVMTVQNGTIKPFSSWQVYDNSTDSVNGRNWTMDVTGLDSERAYTLTVLSKNNWGLNSKPANPYVTFQTAALQKHKHSNVGGIVGGVIGSMTVVMVVVVIVVRQRRKTGYGDMENSLATNTK